MKTILVAVFLSTSLTGCSNSAVSSPTTLLPASEVPVRSIEAIDSTLSRASNSTLCSISGCIVPSIAPFGVSTDLRLWITQPLNSAPNGLVQPGTGSMLCTGPGMGNCLTSYFRESEFEVVAPSADHSYFGEYPYNGQTYIGVIRSYAAGNLRCFSTPDSPCTAPPSSYNVPQAIPVEQVLNVVSYATEKTAENAYGTPRMIIPGAISPTNGNYVAFSNNSLNLTSCAQTDTGSTPAFATAVLVLSVPFGGTVGTQDSLIVDEFEKGPTMAQNHMERYYYVEKLGRVREGASNYDVNTGVYDLNLPGQPPDNVIRNYEFSPSTVPAVPNQCPQNSNPPMNIGNQ